MHLMLSQQLQESDTLLDPKCGNNYENQNIKQKASIINLAINGGNDSFVNQVNITEEMTKCSIWKNLQSPDTHGSDRSMDGVSSGGSTSSKRYGIGYS